MTSPTAQPTPQDFSTSTATWSRAPRRENARVARDVIFSLALASIFGLAIGSREAGMDLVAHALGVPLGMLAALTLGAPGLYIALALMKAPHSAGQLVFALVGALRVSARLLAGLAPAAALFAVTSESQATAAAIATIGLAAAGMAGLFSLIRTMLAKPDTTKKLEQAQHTPAPQGPRQTTTFYVGPFIACAAFSLFCVLVVTRIWSTSLPIMGGAL